MDDTDGDGDEEERPAQRIQRLARERKRRQRLRESETKRLKVSDVNGADGCSTATLSPGRSSCLQAHGHEGG